MNGSCGTLRITETSTGAHELENAQYVGSSCSFDWGFFLARSLVSSFFALLPVFCSSIRDGFVA